MRLLYKVGGILYIMIDLKKHGRYQFTSDQERTIKEWDELFTADILLRGELWMILSRSKEESPGSCYASAVLQPFDRTAHTGSRGEPS